MRWKLIDTVLTEKKKLVEPLLHPSDVGEKSYIIPGIVQRLLFATFLCDIFWGITSRVRDIQFIFNLLTYIYHSLITPNVRPRLLLH